MSKFTTPIFTVEAPGPIILAGVATVVAGSVAKLWIRRHGWNKSHPVEVDLNDGIEIVIPPRVVSDESA